MLTPDYLEHAPDGLAQLMRQLEEDILRDVARRIGKMGGVTETARWQLWRQEQLGGVREDVVRLLAQYSGRTDGEIRRILSESGTAALEEDDALYRAAGRDPAPVNGSPTLVNLLNAGYRQTRGTWQNLTATTANTVTGQFEAALDRAWLQVSSGAFDYQTAIRRAVGDLAQHMTYVTYPSGHRDTLEVAARRAVLTGVNQTALRLQDARMEEMGCEFVETTAHHGARPEHALWQGKVFHVGGAITYQGVFYPDFKTATRYGEGDGLGGWNCRHNKFPFFPGLSERAYTDEKLAQLDARDIEYNGKKYTRYEINQMQRAAERRVRAAKKRYLAEDAAGLDASGSALKLRQAREALARFTRDTGGRPDSSRISVPGFGRSEAGRATAAAQRSHSTWLRSIGAENSELRSLANYYEGKYNNSPAYQLLMGYNRAVQKGDISPLIGIDVYRQTSDLIQQRLVGTTTSNGVTIESFATHFIDRVIGQTSTPHPGMRQGVPVEAALDALQNPIRVGPVRTMPDGDVRQTFFGKQATVAISVRDQRLIQTNPNGG